MLGRPTSCHLNMIDIQQDTPTHPDHLVSFQVIKGSAFFHFNFLCLIHVCCVLFVRHGFVYIYKFWITNSINCLHSIKSGTNSERYIGSAPGANYAILNWSTKLKRKDVHTLIIILNNSSYLSQIKVMNNVGPCVF